MPVAIEDIYIQKQEIENNNFIPKEAHNRLLISRGYYASFLYARGLFKGDAKYKLTMYSTSIEGKDYGSHQKIYESLIRSGSANLMYIGKSLKSYHKLRKDSDYHLHLHIRGYELMLAEQHFKECKERIDFFIENGDAKFLASCN